MSNSSQNPLVPAILSILRRNLQSGQTGAFGIHHLLTALNSHACLQDLDKNPELDLFKKNFLMMNGLYQLQQSLWEDEGLVLNIATLNIRLSSQLESGRAALPEIMDPMREYYLNWQHYSETTAEDVIALLNAFWLQQDIAGRSEALLTLDLEPDATGEQVKQRYQRLASEHHPDKGGDPQQFMAIRQAYELLRH